MHKNKKYTLIILLTSFAFTPSIAEESGENILRHKAWHDANTSYIKCKKVSDSYKYWEIVIECVENIKVKENMHLCHEKASFNYLEGNDKLNCLLFKPSTNDFINRVKELKDQQSNTKKAIN